MITIQHKGTLKRTESFLTDSQKRNYSAILHSYGAKGVDALSSVTPIDTGNSASKWYYTVKFTRSGFNLTWSNSNVNGGIPVVILLQYGHATRGGSYVEGQDFINPAIRPIFDQIADSIWKEVKSL